MLLLLLLLHCRLKCTLTEPLLDSERLIHASLSMVKYIPEELFESLVMHPLRGEADCI